MSEQVERHDILLAAFERMSSEFEDNLTRLDKKIVRYSNYQDKRFDKLESFYKSLLLLMIDKSETQIPKTVDDILKDVRNLGDLERSELLSELYYLYFNERNLSKSEINF